MLQLGSVVDGKYRLLSEIGHGGMSVVYLAINERANKTWAIKEVRKDGGNSSDVFRQRLVAETEMLKRLHHPHLPSIVDVIDKEESFLIVMDYIEGKSLQSMLNHNGAQDPELVIDWAKQLCDTLGYLHSREPAIIYRDMKPANVMLKPDGNVTLIDFGTAREYKEYSQGDTTWLGTRGYAAPEQFGGRGQTDGRTDIYCLGATMYHLITGKSPADTNFVIYPLGQLVPHLAGTGLEKVVSKCCEPEPEKRYQNCGELMYALEHVHDEDDSVLRKRNVQWGGFVACIIMAIISLIGLITFRILEAGATDQSYDKYLEAARLTSAPGDLDELEEQYRKAIRLRPSNPKAYNELLNTIEADGTFTRDEDDVLQNCIRDFSGSTKMNIDYFESGSQREYVQFVYRLANDYYFFYEGDNKRNKAAKWYEKVADSRYLTDQQRSLAKILVSVGEYYSRLESDNNVFLVGDANKNYGDFWNDMVSALDGNVVEKTGGEHYAAGLYKEFAYAICISAGKFREYGVSRNAMLDQLDRIENGLKELTTEEMTVVAIIESAKLLVGNARQAVETVFAGTESDGQ